LRSDFAIKCYLLEADFLLLPLLEWAFLSGIPAAEPECPEDLLPSFMIKREAGRSIR
jgi:hypothetical protein